MEVGDGAVGAGGEFFARGIFSGEGFEAEDIACEAIDEFAPLVGFGFEFEFIVEPVEVGLFIAGEGAFGFMEGVVEVGGEGGEARAMNSG